MTIHDLSHAAVFLPLIGFLAAGLGSRKLGDRFAQLVTCSLMVISTICAVMLFKKVIGQQQATTLILFPWIHIGEFQVDWGLKLDSLSVVMILVVTSVSTLVHIYSVGYMSHDKSIPRFMAYLSLFTFAMLMLVTAPNLVQLFFGWEGVGVASYLLIGFWYEKASANAAAIKAFLVNRIGDIGLALGIAGVFFIFGTVNFDQIFRILPEIARQTPHISFLGFEPEAITLIGVLLFIGAMGKSAQLGLHTWLPDAMEGPTPVSALIHAATMVTAGVFLVARMSPLYEYTPFARDIIVIVGAITAFFAATVALTQTDIKRVIAYSTCSQLGYMFFAAGCSAYGAAIFHLVTHAFFKALLFLGAGSVIHAMSDEQDMTKMGGIYHLIPKTYAFMWIGSLALAGIPYFAGYYSKDAVLESAFLNSTAVGHFAFAIGLLVALLTAFYSWRLLLLTFHGKPQADDRVMAHVHESPLSMLLPLGILSLGALLSGYLGHEWFVGKLASQFWQGALVVKAEHGDIPTWVQIAPLVAATSGIILAFLFYGRNRILPETCSRVFRPIYLFFSHKWYFDDFYQMVFVKRAFNIGQLFWQRSDRQLIDGLGPDGISALSLAIGRFTSRLQTGYVYHYAFAMLIGLVLMISWYLKTNLGW
jgi:NADH-quinone oxidoreductase subunit L